MIRNELLVLLDGLYMLASSKVNTDYQPKICEVV